MERRVTTMLLLLALSCQGGGRKRTASPADAEVEGGAGGQSGTGGTPGQVDAASLPEPPGTGGAPADTGPDAAEGMDAGRDTAPRDTAPRDTVPRDTVPRDTAPRDTAAPPRDADASPRAFQILVLSKTLEYHHDSIPACQQMLRELGATPDAALPSGAQPGSRFTVTVAKEDLSEFTDEGLRPYAMIFWCNPTGTVFTSAGASGATGMAAVQKFLTGGGAWGGVHSATDFENTHQWPWFQDEVNGGNFASHEGDGTPGIMVWEDGPVAADHPVIRGIRSPWSCTDEWYHLNRDPATLPGFSVLGRLSGDQRPSVWVREIPGGGRSFYTIRGHNITVYAEPSFRRLVHQGILWAVRRMK